MKSSRNRLPDRRPAESFELEVEGLRYTATLGRFPDGSVGELFLNNHKCNSSADTAARDGAIVVSIALQHGADLETIRRAPRQPRSRERPIRCRSRHHMGSAAL
jgi:hypothetical protein